MDEDEQMTASKFATAPGAWYGVECPDVGVYGPEDEEVERLRADEGHEACWLPKSRLLSAA